MLRKALFVVAALAMIPTVAQAQNFQAGNWELTLGGGGSSNKGLTQGSFNVNGSIGYFLTKDLEIALRQQVSYADLITARRSPPRPAWPATGISIWATGSRSSVATSVTPTAPAA